jgi:Tfp pilus assembly protein PilN
MLTHIYLTVLGVFRISQLRALNKEWEGLAQQRNALEDFFKNYTLESQDTEFIQQLLKQRLNWSEKLNSLSLNLPSGIWFNEITASLKDMVINGSAVSLEKEEMVLLRKFIDNLKNDAGFSKDFISLELGTVQARSIAGYDISDFVLTGTLKTK